MANSQAVEGELQNTQDNPADETDNQPNADGDSEALLTARSELHKTMAEVVENPPAEQPPPPSLTAAADIIYEEPVPDPYNKAITYLEKHNILQIFQVIIFFFFYYLDKFCVPDHTTYLPPSPPHTLLNKSLIGQFLKRGRAWGEDAEFLSDNFALPSFCVLRSLICQNFYYNIVCAYDLNVFFLCSIYTFLTYCMTHT